MAEECRDLVHVCAVPVEGVESGGLMDRGSVRAAACVGRMVLARDVSMIARCLTMPHRCASSAGRRARTSVRMNGASHRVGANWMTAPGSSAVPVARLLKADVRNKGNERGRPGDKPGRFFCAWARQKPSVDELSF